LWIRLRSFRRQLQTNVRQRWLELLVPLLIITGLIVGGYQLLLRGARFLQAQGQLGTLLLDRTFYLGWSIIFYLLILSNIITAFSTLYRSSEVSFLFTKPLSHLTIFRTKFVENLAYSSWAILILGLPLTLAYGHVQELNLLDMALFLPLGILPYLVIATALGLSLTLAVARLTRWFRMRSIFLTLGLIGTGLFWLYFRFSQQETLLVGEAASFRALNRYLFNLAGTPFPLIPSYWFSTMLTAYARGDVAELFFFGALMITTALVAVELAEFLARRHYYPSFQILETHSTRRKRTARTLNWNPRWLPQPALGLVQKEVLQFVRTPQQWLQFLLFGFFIAVYLVNLSRADFRSFTLSPFWRTLIYLFNFGFSGFTLAALTSRFVFPLISLEGRALWTLRTAPLSLRQVFRVKFWLAVLLFFTLAEVVALVSNYYLSRDWFLTLISTLYLCLMSFALVSLALGLGAVFPQFEERNPMRITSSAGGIITIVLSLVYVGLMAGAMTATLVLWEQGALRTIGGLIIPAVILLNAAYIVLPLKWGRRSLLNLERY
jgi:ABC-2 type transport system permease protein